MVLVEMQTPVSAVTPKHPHAARTIFTFSASNQQWNAADTGAAQHSLADLNLLLQVCQENVHRDVLCTAIFLQQPANLTLL